MRSLGVRARLLGAGERGSAPLEFILVLPLVLLLGLAAVQVAVFMHVRSVAGAAAAEGARVAAAANQPPSAGAREARRLVDRQIPGAVRAVSARAASINGLPTVEVAIRLRVPLVGLIAPVDLTVKGHSVEESL